MKKIESSEEKAKRHIRRLIWLYFWLLLIEGALRKWVLPDYSNPLLLARDPVVIAIYLLAIPAGVFPRNRWTIVLAVIGFLSFLVTFLQLWRYLPLTVIALVGGYGFRSNFFYLPLIFVMARVLRAEDVKRFGWWALLLLVPMSMLMVAQFRAPPDAFLNQTAGGEGEMIMSALGKVRTAGTFSFVVGVVAYLSLATGYLVWALLKPGLYKTWLLAVAGVALVVGIAVSGSRSVVGACAVVVASLVLVIVLRPGAVNRFGRALIVILILGFVVSRLPVFHEGVNVLSTRFTEAAAASEQSVARGLIDRVLASFEEGFFFLGQAPFLGYGLGVGTNAGAKFMTGRAGFLLTEGEWSRIFLESGPVLGLAYVVWRCALVARIGWLCVKSVQLGNLLPLLLFSSSFLPMISGQFGQPTILGFTVFTTGLVLAARNEETSAASSVAGTPSIRVKSAGRIVRGRSAYAERLHGPSAGHGQSNGSVDR
jgi:hypothetical protein